MCCSSLVLSRRPNIYKKKIHKHIEHISTIPSLLSDHAMIYICLCVLSFPRMYSLIEEYCMNVALNLHIRSHARAPNQPPKQVPARQPSQPPRPQPASQAASEPAGECFCHSDSFPVFHYRERGRGRRCCGRWPRYL